METFHVIRTPKRVILSSVENSVSPISPMANLKLLTKVATSLEGENQPQSYQLMKTPVKYQRQLRSLGFICSKFLDIYKLNMAEGESRQISLGNLSLLLDIEKRRVYDIINIIASLRYASKICKDKYQWFGNQYLIQTLTELRALAYQRNYHILLQKSLMNGLSFDELEEASGEWQVSSGENDDTLVFDDNRIGALCQKSIMLFLVSQGEALNFKVISEIILVGRGKGERTEDKTGMRRLYDISNVLESLGLIRRCDSKHVKRPTFLYSGPTLPPYSTLDEGFNRHISELEHLSDTSSDCADLRLVDLVDTEMIELESSLSTQFEHVQSKPQLIINAKKQLFPDMHQTPQQPQPPGFIKAPQSSFKFTNNGSIKIISRDSNQNIKKIESRTCHQRTNQFIRITNNKSFIKLSDHSKPLNVYKLAPSNRQSVSSIENGAVYRVVKHGNIINLVQIKSTY